MADVALKASSPPPVAPVPRCHSILTRMASRGKRAAGEGTLRQRVDGSWEWRTPRGFPVKKSFTSKHQKDVLAKRDAFLRDFDGSLDPAGGELTLADYLDAWLRDAVKPNARTATHEHHRRMCRNHVAPRLGAVKLKDLKPGHVAALYAERLEKGYALGTRRHVKTTLNMAPKRAVRWGYLAKNPADGVPVPKGKVSFDEEDDPNEMRVLDEEQARALVRTARGTEDAPGDRLAALYSLALATGMRQGEILALPWKNVDLREGIVRVRRTLVLVKGGFEYAPPKSDAGRRDVELRPETVEDLRRHRLAQLEEKVKLGGLPSDSGLVFATTTGTPIRRQNLHRRSFKPLLQKAGLPDVRFHDLRHTFASIALHRGADLNTVSKMLGHASVKITLDVYGHLMPGAQKRALSALDGVFG